MARSLLDNADLGALRDLSAKGPAAAVAAALVDTQLLQFDPDDPTWEDRDRLFVAGPAVEAALEQRLTASGAKAEDVVTRVRNGGEAAALAFGAAMASAADGGAWRAWCALDAEACDDGRIWEIARAAAAAGAVQLGVVVTGSDTAALWRACGWTVHEAPAADPAWLLGAVDHLLAESPSVVLVAGNE